MSETKIQRPVGVIGAGSFGTAIANLLAHNAEVLLYSRNPELVNKINSTHRHFNIDLSPRIVATNDLKAVAEKCALIFPIVPSINFREMMQDVGPHLRPDHILIHGTKGFDLYGIPESEISDRGISRKNVSTMSEIIHQESVVVRVGCLSGPNLASEVLEGQPTATVIGSKFDEVIQLGQTVLNSQHFHVFGTYEILGAEFAGALKNIFAIGSGLLKGRGYGKNLQAMLITRGLMEMVHFGKRFGTNTSAFFGTAGIGDLVATSTSSNSRNYTFGYRVGQGESMEEVAATMPELAEGVRTLKITRFLAKYYKLRIPITEMLYNVVFEGFEFEKAIDYLMTYPYDIDVDFL